MENKIEDFVLIIGAMKSGTSSLYKYLSQHPELATTGNKEQHFFSDTNNFSRGYNYYLNSWDWDEDVHRYALESTPAYTRSTHPDKMNAAVNIARMQSDLGSRFKFIYIMRNPIDRIESQYNHALAWETENIADPTAEIIDPEALDTSKYAMQIKEYYRLFRDADILLLNFDDLIKNPKKLLKQICIFLDIDHNHSFDSVDKIYNRRGSRKISIIPGWSRLKRSILFCQLSKITPLKAKKVFRAVFQRKTKAKRKIKLSNIQKEYARKQLESDLAELKSKYGVDVESWGV